MYLEGLWTTFLSEVILWLLKFLFISNSILSLESMTNSSVLHSARSSLARRQPKLEFPALDIAGCVAVVSKMAGTYLEPFPKYDREVLEIVPRTLFLQNGP